MEFVAAASATSPLSFDEYKPSLFELLAEQQLASLLPPTLRYILTLLTHRYPRHLLRILNRFDEIYALGALLVERHYLRTRAGSFTENFYGLKRELATAAELPRAASAAPAAVREALRLRGADLWRNLIIIVGIPYLKRKLDDAYEADAPRALLGAAYNRPPPPGAPWRERARYWARVVLLRRVYPAVNAAYYLSMLGFNLAYLFDSSKYHNPLLWLVGTRIRRMGPADYRAIEALEEKRAAARRGAHATIADRVLGGLSLALPAGIFALKFLEWWHASDFAKQLSKRAAESLDLPPPVVAGLPEPEKGGKKKKKNKDQAAEGEPTGELAPGQEPEDEQDLPDEEQEARASARAPIAASSLLPIYTVPPPARSDLCPICGEEITTAAACQTGVVYCYACIHKWLTGTHPRQEKFMASRAGGWESGEGRCAVTGRRVLGGTEGLRRLIV
ncbi:hypothetical protein VTJ83DRAFT_4744 [Remersonia thermophila]|uniref:Peroxisome assembly protein 12 n=1 Tax=Remersonia thermophila TaxID=72144 RepID=A0ABR4DD05_9PEZI